MRNLAVAMVAFIAIIPVKVSAAFDEHGYFGLGYSYTDANIDGIGSIDNSLVGLIAGYRFHPVFALEARGYGNVSDDELLGVNFEIDSNFSVFGKGIVPLGKYVDLYGLLGMGRVKGTASALGNSASESESEVQYGAGFSFNKGESVELMLEWTKWYNDDGIDANGFNLNLVYRI